jgi:hypothetical protein
MSSKKVPGSANSDPGTACAGQATQYGPAVTASGSVITGQAVPPNLLAKTTFPGNLVCHLQRSWLNWVAAKNWVIIRQRDHWVYIARNSQNFWWSHHLPHICDLWDIPCIQRIIEWWRKELRDCKKGSLRHCKLQPKGTSDDLTISCIFVTCETSHAFKGLLNGEEANCATIRKGVRLSVHCKIQPKRRLRCSHHR